MTDPGSSGGHSQSYNSSRKERGRPNLVICRVCARHRDGFNSTLGVKAKATQFQLPPNSVFAEKSPKKKKKQRRFYEQGFPSTDTSAATPHITHLTALN